MLVWGHSMVLQLQQMAAFALPLTLSPSTSPSLPPSPPAGAVAGTGSASGAGSGYALDCISIRAGAKSQAKRND